MAAFEHALAEAGAEHEIVVYPGAPHSFFDRRHEDFADASADAWERVLGFVARHRGDSDGWRSGRPTSIASRRRRWKRRSCGA